jgi:putative peptidoglycan lipid II flippase
VVHKRLFFIDETNTPVHRFITKFPFIKWTAFRSPMTKLPLMRAVGGLFVLLTAARSLGLVKEILLTTRFGLCNELDAFLIAASIPLLFVSILGNAYGTAIVPVFYRVEQNAGHEPAQHLFQSAMFLGIGFFFLAALLLAAFSPWLIELLAAGFSQEKARLTHSIFLWMLPVVVCGGLSASGAAILNARGTVTPPVLIATVTPILTITLLTLPNVTASGVLVAGFVGGAVVECALTVLYLRKGNFRCLPWFHGMTGDLTQIWTHFLPVSAGSAIHGCQVLIDQSLASRLGEGAVAALSYGGKLVGLAVNLVGQPISTAVFPQFVKAVSEKDWNELRHKLYLSLRISLMISIPVMLVLMACSRPLVTVIFRRGHFTAADASWVAVIQVMAAVQLPVFLVCLVLVRFSQAVMQPRWQFAAGVANFISSLAFGMWLLPYLSEAGIALSKTAVYSVSTLILAMCAASVLRKRRQSTQMSIPKPHLINSLANERTSVTHLT